MTYSNVQDVWGIITSLDDRSLGEVLHFITVVCASFAFLPHVDVGNDSAVCVTLIFLRLEMYRHCPYCLTHRFNGYF